MQRNFVKYLIDVLLFIDLVSVSVVGILLGFIIPRGRGPDGSKFFLGLHRHQWGNLHLYLSLLLLVLLVVHLWLNWTWILCTSKRVFAERWKKGLFLILGSPLLVLTLGWLMFRC
jgi:hypothetical protein